jgi:hypothetical protein
MSDPVGGAPPGPPDEPGSPDVEPHPVSARPPDGSPYLHLPWPLVAGALLAVLAIALITGLFANRTLRPQPVAVAAAATPTPLPAASTPVPPTRAPTPAPATPTPPQVAATPPAVTAAITPLIVGTLAPPPIATLQTTVSTLPLPSPSSPTPLPTVDPTLAQEVGEAYVTFWQVRSDAFLNLDPTHLPDVATGDYLDVLTRGVAELRGQGRAIKTQVSLNYRVVQALNEMAIVIDRVQDDSFYVNPDTQAPLTEPANDLLSLQVKLVHDNGQWKVVESVSAD